MLPQIGFCIPFAADTVSSSTQPVPAGKGWVDARSRNSTSGWIQIGRPGSNESVVPDEPAGGPEWKFVPRNEISCRNIRYIRGYRDMIPQKRSTLSDYVGNLLSAGRLVFNVQEAERALGVEHGAFLDAAERLQRRGVLLSPRRGFYVVVPPQYASWGAPPPGWFIDALMRREGQAYYVGLLKAAELHGATHQAVMEFQVVTAKRLPRIRAGRSVLVFYFRKDMKAAAAGIEDRKTETGAMKISSPALTAIDLLRYPQASGGLDHVATVLSDLGPKIDPGQLEALSRLVERSVVQRLGHLLDHLGHDAATGSMLDILRARGPLTWTELDRREARNPDFTIEPRVRDPRWRVVVGRALQVDA